MLRVPSGKARPFCGEMHLPIPSVPGGAENVMWDSLLEYPLKPLIGATRLRTCDHLIMRKWSLGLTRNFFYPSRLVFKKRLFLGERPLQTSCPAEMELLYYQVLHSVRHDRLPIETDEAVSDYYCIAITILSMIRSQVLVFL